MAGCLGPRKCQGVRMKFLSNSLLTDLYQLSMIQAYLESGQTDTAVFEFFVRTRFGETASIRINERRGHFPAVFCFVVSPCMPWLCRAPCRQLRPNNWSVQRSLPHRNGS